MSLFIENKLDEKPAKIIKKRHVRYLRDDVGISTKKSTWVETDISDN